MIDKNHPLTMYLFKVGIGLIFLFSFDAWLGLWPPFTILAYVATLAVTNKWIEWIYWQLVISWLLLVSRFKE